MKELWSYLVHSFEGSEPYAKKLRKTSSLNEYRCEVGNLFRACDLYPGRSGTVEAIDKWGETREFERNSNSGFPFYV